MERGFDLAKNSIRPSVRTSLLTDSCNTTKNYAYQVQDSRHTKFKRIFELEVYLKN